jgi:glutathione peroxidase
VSQRSFFELSAMDLLGKKVDFDCFKNQVCLVVNVASNCPMARNQYLELQALYENYKGRGFHILALRHYNCNGV